MCVPIEVSIPIILKLQGATFQGVCVCQLPIANCPLRTPKVDSPSQRQQGTA